MTTVCICIVLLVFVSTRHAIQLHKPSDRLMLVEGKKSCEEAPRRDSSYYLQFTMRVPMFCCSFDRPMKDCSYRILRSIALVALRP